MLLIKNSLLLIALSLLVGCASRPPVVYQPPQVPPLPPEIGLKREPNLTDRLTRLLMRSEKSSDSSPKSQPTFRTHVRLSTLRTNNQPQGINTK